MHRESSVGLSVISFINLEFNNYLCKNTPIMERYINLHIEKLPEGYYLATSENIQGLVAQGRTITETLEIARDIAKKLIEAQKEEMLNQNLDSFQDSFDIPLVVGL